METTVTAVLRRAETAGPKCGAMTVIAIDGPAGSGKTTLAGKLTRASGAQLVHMDDLYPGWHGLRSGGQIVRGLLQTLAEGRPAVYRRYDWHEEQYAEEHHLNPSGILVVEGVGSVRREYVDKLSVIVIVREPDPGERLRRGLARDGAQDEPLWQEWMVEEDQLHAEVGLAELAHIHVDGHGRIIP